MDLQQVAAVHVDHIVLAQIRQKLRNLGIRTAEKRYLPVPVCPAGSLLRKWCGGSSLTEYSGNPMARLGRAGFQYALEFLPKLSSITVVVWINHGADQMEQFAFVACSRI